MYERLAKMNYIGSQASNQGDILGTPQSPKNPVAFADASDVYSVAS